MPEFNDTNRHTSSVVPVSIVIPTFNRATMLPKAIDSALAQTFPVEVIVVNHGSTDNTDAVVSAYGDQVRYIERADDFGPHFCWLEGVLQAKGDFIHLQFDDDWIEPEFIAECMKVLTDSAGFAFCCADIFDEETGVIQSTQFKNWLPATGTYPRKQIERRVLRSLVSPGQAVYRKQILLDALYQGRLPLSEAEYHGVGPDCFVTLLSMLRYNKVGFVRASLATFRAHDGSITVDASRESEKSLHIASAYNDVKNYYREMKLLRILRKLTGHKFRQYLNLRVPNRLRRVVRYFFKHNREPKFLRLLRRFTGYD